MAVIKRCFYLGFEIYRNNAINCLDINENQSKINPKHLGNTSWILFKNQGSSYSETVRGFLLRSVGRLEVLNLDVIRFISVDHNALRRT